MNSDSSRSPLSACSDLSPATSASSPSTESSDPNYFSGSHSSRSSFESQKELTPVDPLCRHYPKPTADIDVAEALAREPRKWTLGYWAKNARDTRVSIQDKETKSRQFEETKRDLLRAKEEMSRSAVIRR